MIRVCPLPNPWNRAYKNLLAFSERNPCTPESPPAPLILAGWAFSNDVNKAAVWEEMITWAANNHALDEINFLVDRDFRYVDEMFDGVIGPGYGPLYLPWNYEPRELLSKEVLAESFASLVKGWALVAGDKMAQATTPYRFTGSKKRKLEVVVKGDLLPPWGSWDRLPRDEERRRTFTRLRSAINALIAPHHVDHVDFIVERDQSGFQGSA